MRNITYSVEEAWRPSFRHFASVAEASYGYEDQNEGDKLTDLSKSVCLDLSVASDHPRKGIAED